MIEICDFVKLFCIMNAKIFENPKDCYDKAREYATLLHANGEFNSDRQVIPNDFLAVLNDIKEGL